MQMCPFCDKVYDESEYSHCPYCSGEIEEDISERPYKDCPECGGIPFDYTEEDLEEARRWERIVNDDVQDTGGEETCMVN